jgi:hypothetical protein
MVQHNPGRMFGDDQNPFHRGPRHADKKFAQHQIIKPFEIDFRGQDTCRRLTFETVDRIDEDVAGRKDRVSEKIVGAGKGTQGEVARRVVGCQRKISSTASMTMLLPIAINKISPAICTYR